MSVCVCVCVCECVCILDLALASVNLWVHSASLLMSDRTLIQLLFKLTWFWCVCVCVCVCVCTYTRGEDLLSYDFMWCPLIALEENSAI